MRAITARFLLLACALALCCGCRGESQSTSTNPNSEVMQVPTGLTDAKARPTPPPLAPGASAGGSQKAAGGLTIPSGVPGGPKGPGAAKKP